LVGLFVVKRNPQLFLKITLFVDGVGEGMEKAGSLLGEPAFCVFNFQTFRI
jgi:hypothetical protein